MNLKFLHFAAAGVCSLLFFVNGAFAQGGAFTYQGRVTANGANFNGMGQFKFALVTSTASSQPALATAVMGGVSPNQFVGSCTVTQAGSGYCTPPAVNFSGGGGSGATAQAILTGGAVTSITVLTPGSGYSSAPTITIASPPASYATWWSNDGASANGSEPVAIVTIPVSGGLFTVVLGDNSVPNMQSIDPGVFLRPNLELQIWFSDGMDGFAALNPPQSLTASPSASVANFAGSVLGPIQTSQLIGTIPSTLLPPSVLTNGSANIALNGAFAGNGAGLTNLSVSNLTGIAPPGMALIPAGSFLMGDNLDGELDAAPTSFYVSAFFMDVNLVSLSQWQSVYYWATEHGYAFDNSGTGKTPNTPIESVNWYDCLKWCNARSQQAGKVPVYYTDAEMTLVFTNGQGGLLGAVYPNWSVSGFRLPTEAEWEKAARGGLAGQRFPWGNEIIQTLANYTANPFSVSYDLGPLGSNPLGSPTSPVGSFAANGYGLFDMAGNLYQWCWDWYGASYGPTSANPTGPDSGALRMLRGGSWDSEAYLCRTALRAGGDPVTANATFGFRSALSLGQ